MKIITTIEATTDAEQAEVAKLIAQLTGVTATTQTIGAKTANPVLDLVDPSVFEQVRHQIRATVHRLVQDGYRDQVRLALDLFGVQKISEVSNDQLEECLDTLSGIGQEEV